MALSEKKLSLEELAKLNEYRDAFAERVLEPLMPVPARAPKRLKEEGATGEPGMVIFSRGSWKTAYQIQADGSWRKLEEGLALRLREDWEKRGRPEK